MTRARLSSALVIVWILLGSCSPIEISPTQTQLATASPTKIIRLPTLTPSFSLPTPSPSGTSTTSTLPPTPLPSATPPPWRYELTFGAWDQVTALAWSPKGSLLAVAAGGCVHIFDAATFQQQHILEVNSWSDRLAFSPVKFTDVPDLLAVAAKEGKIQLWDAHAGKFIAAWEAHKKGAKSLVFSPDGSTLASTGGDAMVRLWNISALLEQHLESPPLLAEMIGGAYAIPDVRFSPDGSLVASVDIHDIRLRDPASQRLVRTLRGDTSIFRIAFSPDGSKLASAEMGNRVSLWDVASGQRLGQWSASEDQAGIDKVFIWDVSFSPDGSLLAAGKRTQVRSFVVFKPIPWQ